MLSQYQAKPIQSPVCYCQKKSRKCSAHHSVVAARPEPTNTVAISLGEMGGGNVSLRALVVGRVSPVLDHDLGARRVWSATVIEPAGAAGRPRALSAAILGRVDVVERRVVEAIGAYPHSSIYEIRLISTLGGEVLTHSQHLIRCKNSGCLTVEVGRADVAEAVEDLVLVAVPFCVEPELSSSDVLILCQILPLMILWPQRRTRYPTCSWRPESPVRLR